MIFGDCGVGELLAIAPTQYKYPQQYIHCEAIPYDVVGAVRNRYSEPKQILRSSVAKDYISRSTL